jgi:hypothetical protein
LLEVSRRVRRAGGQLQHLHDVGAATLRGVRYTGPQLERALEMPEGLGRRERRSQPRRIHTGDERARGVVGGVPVDGKCSGSGRGGTGEGPVR